MFGVHDDDENNPATSAGPLGPVWYLCATVWTILLANMVMQSHHTTSSHRSAVLAAIVVAGLYRAHRVFVKQHKQGEQ